MSKYYQLDWRVKVRRGESKGLLDHGSGVLEQKHGSL